MRTTFRVGVSLFLAGMFCLAALAAMPVQAFTTSSTHARFDAGLAQTAAANPAAPLDALVTLSSHDASAAAALESAGVRVARFFPNFGVAYVVGPGEGILRLADVPGVLAVTPNSQLAYFGGTDTVATRAREAWDEKSTSTTPLTVGGSVINGAGIGVAVVDSGIDGTHPDLTPALVQNLKFVCTTPGLVSTLTNTCYGDFLIEGFLGASQTCNPDFWLSLPDTDTTSGHGTHVAGIVAGQGVMSSGRFTGVAPGASLYGLGVGEGLSVLYALEAFNWVDCHHATVSPPIRIVTNSWGPGPGPYDPLDPISIATNQLVVGDGLVVLFATGNDGPATDTVSPYARNPTAGVIGVASYNDDGSGNRNFGISDFSSRGDPLAVTTAGFPDVSAPGDLVVSTQAKTGPVCLALGLTLTYVPYYCTISGTSMATPHTAGVAALMLQADPTLSPADVECVLKNTAHQFTTPGGYGVTDSQACATTQSNYAAGHGLVDAIAALNDPLVGASGTGSPLPQIGSQPHIYNKVATAGFDPEIVGLLQAQWTEVAGVEVQLSERSIVSGTTPLAGNTRFVIFDPLGGTTILTTTLAADTLPAQRIDAPYNFPIVGDYTIEAQSDATGTWRAFDSFHVTAVSV